MADRQITEAELLRRVIATHLDEIHTAMPGKVVKYYESNQTADVAPQLKNGELSLPTLQKIRVAWPRGGDGYLVFPLTAGDYGLLVFCERDLTAWIRKGEATEPGDMSRHGLNSAVFYPGVYPDGHALSAPTGLSVLAGNDLRLGASDATNPVLKGNEIYSAFFNWVAAFQTWTAAIESATAVPSEAIDTASNTLVTAISNARSSKVKVK